MDALVFWVNDSLSASLGVALAASLIWGVVSVLLSPCHLGTIPLVVGMVGTASLGSPRRGQGAVLSFSLAGGMLVAVALLGGVISIAGYAAQSWSGVTNYLVAAVFVVAGLNLVGLIRLPIPSLQVKGGERRGIVAAVLLGFVFGLGLSPCTFAFLAPILGLTFGNGAESPLRGILLLLAFGVGHCGIIGLAGSSSELVQRYLDWNARSRAHRLLKTICGVLVLGAAALLVYKA